MLDAQQLLDQVATLDDGTNPRPVVHLPLKTSLDGGGLAAGSLSRISAATYIDREGVLQNSWGNRDQLVDTDAQNDITNVWWTGVRAANSTANAIIGNTDNNGHGISRVIPVTEGTLILSAELKAGSVNWARLSTWSASAGTYYTYFDLVNGALGTQATSIGRISDVGDGWYRCSIVVTIEASSLAYIYAAEANGDITFAGDNSTVNTYVRNIMLEELPSGNVIGPDLFDQEATTAVTSGSDTVAGTIYRIVSQSTLDFTTVGAPDNSADTVFIATAVDTLGSGDELAEITSPHKGTYGWPYSAGSEGITAQNDRDFSSGTSGNWIVSKDGSGTLAYDTTDLGGVDDKQIKITSSGDSYLYAGLSGGFWTAVANTLHHITAKVYVPSTNTRQTVKLSSSGLDTDFNLPFSPSLDSFVTISGYFYVAADTAAQLLIGFNGDPADGDILYIDDVSVRPVQTSWTPYGTNTMEIDETEEAIKVTGVDDSNGMRLYFRDTNDLTADITPGDWYKVDFLAKAGSGDSIVIKILSGVNPWPVLATTPDIDTSDFASYSMIFQGDHITSNVIKTSSVGVGEELWIKDITIQKIPPLALLEPSDFINSATIPAKPRFETDGLLVEGAATNLLTYSEDLTEWVEQSGESAALNAVGPDGVSNSAATITDAASSSTAALRYDYAGALSPSTYHTFSVYIKEGTAPNFTLAIRDNGNSTWLAQSDFGWSSGVPAVLATDNGSNLIQAIGNGWYRISVTGATTASPSQDHRLYVTASRYNISPTAGDTIIAYGAQFEETPYPTSYIPTDGTQVSRSSESADGTYGYTWTLTQALKNILGAASPSIGTLVVKCHMLQDFNTVDTSFRGLITCAANTLNILYFDSAEGNMKSYDGTTSPSGQLANVDWSDDDYVTFIVKWDSTADGGSGYIHVQAIKDDGTLMPNTGNEAGYDGSYNPATLLQLCYGNELPIHIRKIAFYDSYLTDSQVGKL